MTNRLYSFGTRIAGATKRNVKTTSITRPSKFIPKLPNYVILSLGILVGIILTSLVFIRHLPSKTVTEPKTSSEQVANLANNDKEPRFEFYSELTQNPPEVNTAPQPVTKTLDLKSPPKAINRYLVQAGSFRQRADADALKATLNLNGFDATIELARLESGEVWHRVMVGPFKTEALATENKKSLKNLDVDAILVVKNTN